MSQFRIVNHQIPSAHIREFTRATAHSDEEVLQLVVNQYIPLDNPDPQPGDVTIIAAHANAFPKELYEPLWDDILGQAKLHGWRIRSIWISDVAWQGESGIINERLLGNDPSWDDHPRDLMNLVNLKRKEMPRPIIGIGHSMGGAHLAKLSLIHPSLFTTLVLLDPVIQPHSAEKAIGSERPNMVQMSTFRRPVWPSRQAAATAFAKSPFYQAWDPRCFDKWIQYGLRDCPNHYFPDSPAPQVSLGTPAAQEVWTFVRPNYERYGVNGRPINRTTHPDIHTDHPALGPSYRSESYALFKALPHLRPSCMLILGGESRIHNPALNEERRRIIGTGGGGSGGEAEGRVRDVMFDGVGHLVPMEVPRKTAEKAAEWVGREIKLYREVRAFWEREWWSKELKEKQQLDDKWKALVGGPLKPPAKEKKDEAKL